MRITLPETEAALLSEIRPYWRNPRRIPPEAVEAVRRSLEDYGDVQPIVVDSDYVIVVGHTRYQALQQLGVGETEVYVARDLTPEKAKEYRLADNKIGEMTSWDHGQLVMELREWQESLVKAFFPDMDLNLAEINASDREVTRSDIEKAAMDVTRVKDPGPVLVTQVCCPACLQTFAVGTASMPGLSRMDLEQLAAAAVGDGGTQ